MLLPSTDVPSVVVTMVFTTGSVIGALVGGGGVELVPGSAGSDGSVGSDVFPAVSSEVKHITAFDSSHTSSSTQTVSSGLQESPVFWHCTTQQTSAIFSRSFQSFSSPIRS